MMHLYCNVVTPASYQGGIPNWLENLWLKLGAGYDHNGGVSGIRTEHFYGKLIVLMVDINVFKNLICNFVFYIPNYSTVCVRRIRNFLIIAYYWKIPDSPYAHCGTLRIQYSQFVIKKFTSGTA